MADASRAVRFLRDELPERFARGVAILASLARDGDPWAEDRLADVEGADGVARVRLLGPDEELFIDLSEGTLRVDTEPAPGRPQRSAVAIDRDLAELLTRESEDAPGDDDTRAVAAALLANRRAEEQTAAEPLRFHVHFDGLPDLGRRTLRVNLGDDAPPPETPAFAVTVQWDVLEDLRDGEITPMQVLTGGKLRFSGDYARALSLGMRLAQQAEKGRR